MFKSEYISIDLGTSKIRLGFMDNDNFQIKFSDVTYLISQYNYINSQNYKFDNIQVYNSFQDVKRFIGRKYDNYTIQKNIQNWPFKVIKDINGKPQISLICDGQEIKFLAENFLTIFLKHLNKLVQDSMNKQIQNVIITIPAEFDVFQRQSVIEAGKAAGFKEVRIINESSAIAIAYGKDIYKQGEDKILLVFDLGGGALDVFMLKINENKYQVLATTGSDHLGGDDIDQKMTDILFNYFKKKTEIDISKNKEALERLKIECKRAKHVLSYCQAAQISVYQLAQNKHLEFNLSLNNFNNDVFDQYFKLCIFSIESIFKKSGIDKSEVHDIILLGGSTRIPKLRYSIYQYFDGKKIIDSLNPNETVCKGAAIYAKYYNTIKLQEVVPQNIGIEISEGKLLTILKKNSQLANTAKISLCYNQIKTGDIIKFYLGNCKEFKYNVFIGQVKLKGIPKDCNEPWIEIFIKMDELYVLTIKVFDLYNSYSYYMEIIYSTFEYKVEEKKCYGKQQLKKKIQNLKIQLFNSKQYINQLQLVDEWLIQNQDAEIEQFSEKYTDLEQIQQLINVQKDQLLQNN